jgi:uncharacterized protein YheU (UPF0270 family)
MKIPWQSLSQPALIGLIQEFVSREGTEYGVQEFELETKVEQVMTQLKESKAEILFDDETQTTSIVIVEHPL